MTDAGPSSAVVAGICVPLVLVIAAGVIFYKLSGKNLAQLTQQKFPGRECGSIEPQEPFVQYLVVLIIY